MRNGWIALHRSLLDWEWYSDANTVRVFLHLLLRANHKPNKWRGIEVQTGSLITGRKALAEELKLTERQIRTALTKLKSTNEIAIKATKAYSIITLVNWASYQGKDDKATNKTSNSESIERPTSDQQTTTNNNVTSKQVNNKTPLSANTDYVRQVIELYNELVPSMPAVRSISTARTKAVQGRDKHKKLSGELTLGSLERWKEFFKYVESRDFLTGREGTWTSCNFDWIVKQENFNKIVEGNYQNTNEIKQA